MAEKSLFFNAFPDESTATGYDRNYNADDLSDWLVPMFNTGVVKSDTDKSLKVKKGTGLVVNVEVGRASIKGKGYLNDSLKALTIDTPPTGSQPRYDYIVLRYDNTQVKNARKITAEYVKNSEVGVKPTYLKLTRNDNIYELMLAIIEVKVGATSIEQSNIIDTREDKTLCGWFTPVKGYEDYYDAITQRFESVVILDSLKTTIVTDLTSNLYSSKYSIVSVYTNGIKEPRTAYSVSVSSGYIVITFNEAKSAGAKINVVLDNFIDGEGLATAIASYNSWVADVQALKQVKDDYIYICNGKTDNVELSNLVKTWLNVGDNSSRKINIIGTFGMTAPASGDGTTASPYNWFDLIATNKTRRIILDFTRCSQISLPTKAGKYNIVFNADNVEVIGVNLIANETTTSTIIKVFSSGNGKIKAVDCRFWITAYQDSTIAYTGNFVNCRGSIANTINNSYCFITSDGGLLKLDGGEYYAYTGDSTKISAIVGQSSTNAVSILYGVSAPTNARSGYYQTNAIYQYSGGGVINCTDLVSALSLNVVSGISNIRGTIAKSKSGLI